MPIIIMMAACQAVETTQVTASASPTAQPQTDAVPLRVVAQASPLGDQPKEALFTVVVEAQEWEKLRDALPQQAYLPEQATGHPDGEVVLVLFIGVRPTSGYAVTIDEIRLAGQTCTVQFQEVKPAQGTITEPARTLPFLLAAIPIGSFPRNSRVTFIFTEIPTGEKHQQDIQIP
jgi:hypothetical protein